MTQRILSLIAAHRQPRLGEYFAGERKAFDLPLKPQGTVFQQKVWQELRRIKHGARRTYGQLAHVLGRPTAVRAAGAANGRNPLPLFIPCHRVIGASGALTGFSGGLEAKRMLLALERGHHGPMSEGREAAARSGAYAS